MTPKEARPHKPIPHKISYWKKGTGISQIDLKCIMNFWAGGKVRSAQPFKISTLGSKLFPVSRFRIWLGSVCRRLMLANLCWLQLFSPPSILISNAFSFPIPQRKGLDRRYHLAHRIYFIFNINFFAIQLVGSGKGILWGKTADSPSKIRPPAKTSNF